MHDALDLPAPPAFVDLLHQVAVATQPVAVLALVVVLALAAVVAHPHDGGHLAGIAAVVVVDDGHRVQLLYHF